MVVARSDGSTNLLMKRVLMSEDDSDTDTIDVTPIIDPLSSEDVDVDTIVPEVYNELLSWKSWAKRATPYGLAIIACLGAVIALLAVDDSALPSWLFFIIGSGAGIIVGIMSFMIYREYWRWTHEPYYADPHRGVLFQYQAKNKWLYLLGSGPRTLDLDTADYLPASQTFWEQYLPLRGFRESCTVTIDGPGQHDAEHFADIHDLMYGERLSAIILYRKQMEQAHQGKDLQLQDRQAYAAEQTVLLLHQTVDGISQLLITMQATNQLIHELVTLQRGEPSEPESSTGHDT